MNATTTIPATSSNSVRHELSVYDLTRWKPLPFAEYVDQLGACFLTEDDPTDIVSKREVLRSGVNRVVTLARVIDHDANGVPFDSVQPFLMLLFNPENSSRNVCFVRTDVELWLA